MACLGIGAREDAFARGVSVAAEQGVNFFFFYHLSSGKWAAALAELARANRHDVFLTTGSGSRTVDGLRRSLDTYLQALGTDHLDAFFAEYVNPSDDPDEIHGDDGVLAELARWKAEGRIRYVGASAHDRGVSRRLAEDPRLDVLMTRYNMAHRKVADEVFPVCRAHDVALVVFTATRWATLLKGHPEWDGPAPAALDCLRFCAAHPDVDVVLSAPADGGQLVENIGLLTAGEMDDDEHRCWERYGDLVYGDGSGSFETAWP